MVQRENRSFLHAVNLNICSVCDLLGDKHVLYEVICVSYYITTITCHHGNTHTVRVLF